ncbi:MAG: hypothetical protein FWD30_02760 [Dehalococcoidia bacterium]|nr:hypothetical protein [Dehalococcoidia bacterium]
MGGLVIQSKPAPALPDEAFVISTDEADCFVALSEGRITPHGSVEIEGSLKVLGNITASGSIMQTGAP